MKTPSQMKQKRCVFRRKSFLGFGCNGLCFSKISFCSNGSAESGEVRGEEANHESPQIANPIVFKETDQSQHGPESGEQFAFPVLNSEMEILPVEVELKEEKVEEEPRKSLEVFGSHMMKKGEIALNLERKLSMLTWDAIPKSQNVPTTLECAGMYDGIGSDASSDLFEIENISGIGSYPLLTTQESDDMSSCIPTTQYEPNEARTERSVVKAGAADVSFVSDYDEKNVVSFRDMVTTSTPTEVSKSKSTVGKAHKSHFRRLGCRSHKAVSVAETAYRANEKTKPMSAGNSQAETMGKDQ